MMPTMTDDDAKQLRDADWSGAFYELGILIGPYGDDAVLKTATKALLSAVRIEHLWRNVYSEPERIEGDGWTLEDMSHGSHLFSLVELPSGPRVNCGVIALREDGKYSPLGDDWLVLYIPIAALGHLDERVAAYELGEDEGAASLVWRRPIDDWLAQVAIEVRHSVSFKLALIGEEAAGEDDYVPTILHKDRWAGVVLADGTYLPATC